MQRIAMLALWLCATLACSVAAADGVVVELRAEASVSRPLVLVRDIAVLRGGTVSQRDAIGNLDLVLLSNATPSTNISRRLIEVRLIVAGIAADGVSFGGAESVHVSAPSVLQASAAAELPQIEPPSESISDELIAQRLKEHCSQSLGLAVEDVNVHLSQPVAANALRSMPQGDTEVRLVPSPSVSPGSNSATVQFWQQGELVRSVVVRYDCVVTKTVVVLNRFIPRGTVITGDIVSEERRPISESGLLGQLRDVVGTEVVRDLAEGTILSGNMVRLARSERPQPAVRNRDLVCMTYQIPGLNLQISDAVAMQDGQIGDLIRVMNPQSQRVVSAIIVAPGHVQVQAVR